MQPVGTEVRPVFSDGLPTVPNGRGAETEKRTTPCAVGFPTRPQRVRERRTSVDLFVVASWAAFIAFIAVTWFCAIRLLTLIF